jgi:hypothetical protein
MASGRLLTPESKFRPSVADEWLRREGYIA